MSDKIYGVDLKGEVTPKMARDAMVRCFRLAHHEDTGFEEEAPEGYCRELVKKAFSDAGGDFDNPTKESVKKTCDGLADFAKRFRNQEIIQKHYNQILQLVDKLE